MIHLFMGPMGASKSYEGVKYAILPALKEGRRVVSNIRGLDHERIANYLKLPVEDVQERLIVITETSEDETIGPRFMPSKDGFWGNEDNTGFIKWGDVLVLDECWAWLRDRKLVTEPALNFFRKHRHYIGGSGNWSCEIYLITQTEKDISPAIRDVVERVVKLESLRATGSRKLYLRHEYQGLNDRVPTSSRHVRDTAIYPLYKSHKVEGASEASVDNRNVWWRQREALLAAVLFVVLAVAVPVYGIPYVKHLGITKQSAGLGQNSSPTSPQSHQIAAGAGGTVPQALPPVVGPAAAAVPPQMPVAGVVPSPAQVGPETQTAVTVPNFGGGGGLSGASFGSSTSAPARRETARYAPTAYHATQAPQGRDEAPKVSEAPQPPPKPASFVQVAPLRGDPAAVDAVTKAFCDLNACRVVIRPETSQIVLVGTNAEILGLQTILDQLGERPAGLMVNALIVELEENSRDAFGFSLDGPRGALGANTTEVGGVTARLPIGSFAATLQVLQGNGSARVLTAPSVMTWPGEKAQVTAGLEVPVLGSISTADNGRQRQDINYRQSGVILNIEQVSAGIRPVFRVNLEVSNFSETESGVAGSPTKSNRSVSTVAELRDGEVLLLGGMDREYLATNRDRLPLVNIPISKSTRTIRTRVFVALSARAATSVASVRAETSQSGPEGLQNNE
jgi:zona occludens toxin